MDLRLYLVTDRSLSRGRSTFEIVDAAVRGGITMVQLREKALSTRAFMHEAQTLQPLLRRHGIPLIINDRLDVALAVGADGVHLGQDDMPLAAARRIADGRLAIGISVESVADAVAAAEGGADYLGASPVYATPTKTDTAAPLGLDGLRAICAAVALPVVGIGGMNAATAAGAIRAGAAGVAVVSAIVSAPAPAAAARELRGIVDGARPA